MKDTDQTRSPSYRLAFADPEFLLRNELRPVRLQLELLKPELAFQEEEIDATIVMFGSARTPAPEDGRPERIANYEEARRFARMMSERRSGDGRRNVIVSDPWYYAAAGAMCCCVRNTGTGVRPSAAGW